MANQPFEQYTCLHTMSLSDNVDPVAFEHALLNDIMPKVHVSRRNIRGVSLEHRLLKVVGGQGTKQYIWQVRASNLDMVGQEPNYRLLLDAIETDVSRALAEWGNVESVSTCQEIGGVEIS
jgi:hypothetical protein